MTDAAKVANVRTELDALRKAADRSLPAAIEPLAERLKAVNTALWNIEDEIRRCEGLGDFGPRFVAMARSIYKTNDQRAAIKRQINALLGSELFEEKAYVE